MNPQIASKSEDWSMEGREETGTVVLVQTAEEVVSGGLLADTWGKNEKF